MIHRSIKPLKSNSFFLFGARGTGKSTYLKEQWGESHHYINLLQSEWESRYIFKPDQLIADLEALPKVDLLEVKKLKKVSTGFKPTKVFYVSRSQISSAEDGVMCVSWQNFLKEVFYK